MLRTGLALVPLLVAAACIDNSVDVEASVQGSRNTGNYVATVMNHTDADLYVTCTVDSAASYGSVGSDRFLVRATAGEDTYHRARVRIDDIPVEYRIQCSPEPSLIPLPTAALDLGAAGDACSAARRFMHGADDAPPARAVRMGRRVLTFAQASADAALIAVAERMVEDATSDDGWDWIHFQEDADDACDALGVGASLR